MDDYVAAEDFSKAIQMSMEEFSDHVKYCRDAWLPARILVQKGINNRLETHKSGRVIELEIGCPFEVQNDALTLLLSIVLRQDHLVDLEIKLNISGQLSLVIYPNTNDKTSWRVKAIKKSPTTFENRLDLPERLAGNPIPSSINPSHLRTSR